MQRAASQPAPVKALPEGQSGYLEKLARHADQRLGSSAPFAHRLAAYRRFLKLEEHRVRLAHGFGAGGCTVAQHRSDLLDFLLRGVFTDLLTAHPVWGGSGVKPPLALLAVGGYGRRELNPYSDIDIVFVHPELGRAALGVAEAFIRQVLEALVELGLALGSHSTLSLPEALRLSNSDMRTKTAFVQCRYLAGDEVWARQLAEEFEVGCVRGQAEEYVAWRMEDQAKRHQRYGLTVSLQEPNIKNGCGGLRDYQNLLWVSYFKQGLRSIPELVDRGLLSRREGRQLDAAYDFLMRVRNDLHYLCRSKVCSDVLTLEYQERVAENLGYAHPQAIRRVEAFMRDYYLHARNVFHLSETLTERLSVKPPPRRTSLPVLQWMFGQRSANPPVDGFQARDQSLEPIHPGVFEEDPGRFLRVFRHAQRSQASLSAELRQLIRQKLPLIRRASLGSSDASDAFQAILAERGAVGRALRQMHEVDVLGRYLPEFAALTCLPQHDFAHRYTADEHTLVCIEKLDALTTATDPRHRPYRMLWEKAKDPLVVPLALLLHETGKATGARSPTEASALFAQTICRRLHLSAARRRTVTFLIDHQHTLLQTAEHHDLEDPHAIAAFAAIVGSLEHLEALTLFTWVDAQGTDESSWTDWKDLLVWQLYDATARHLAGQIPETRGPTDREGWVKRLGHLLPNDIRDELEAHVWGMPDRYFATQAEAEVRDHVLLVHEFLARRDADEALALAPLVRTLPHPEHGHWEIRIVGWARRDFLTKIAGCFAAVRLNILSASVYTREDSLALVTLRVTGPEGRLPRHLHAALEADSLLARSLGPENLALRTLLEKPAAADSLRRRGPADFPTRIRVVPDKPAGGTRIEIETPDRLGLLHDLLAALDRLGLHILRSHISTEKGAARDSFLVASGTTEGHLRPDRTREIHRAIEAAAAGGPSG